jgi:hypothetical protein
MLRRIFGPKRDEVAGGWRKVNNEELVTYVFHKSIIFFFFFFFFFLDGCTVQCGPSPP